MKVEMRDYRRDGAVYVDFRESRHTNDNEHDWLKDVGMVGAMVAGAVLALAWLIIL